MIRKHVIYQGRVQGVGFRYTAHDLAKEFDVAGFVRNLPNGNVELAAQGTQEQVDTFLAAIAKRMANYIVKSTVAVENPTIEQGFQIRY